MDVPLIVFVHELLQFHADVMPDPGAKRSRQVPQFENGERASVDVLEPTVRAFGVAAGE